ncbi:MAG: putative lipid II flippase FtsW [Pseudomonadota bacterium]
MPSAQSTLSYDWSLLITAIALLLTGLVMVASTSLTLGAEGYGDPLYFFWRQLRFVGMGLVLFIVAVQIPVDFWEKFSILFLLAGIALLVLVLIPGIGHEVNGSLRWLRFGFMNLQPSELMKLFVVMYLAGYLCRHKAEVQRTLMGFLRPLVVLLVITGLLLLEPDYGATVVLFSTVLGMLFLAGVPLSRFIAWVFIGSVAMFILVLLAPYRIERLTTFLDPWADPFNSGFQLTQALIAIGRGEWFGMGLGNSVQKLAYLPEAHTDFIFAILAEELGLVGGLTIILLFTWLIWRAFAIAHAALPRDPYAAYVAYGIGLNIGLQAAISLGVNMGMLPTKGLTLPLMSHGGSSMLVCCLMLALLVRVDYENRRG